MAQEKTTLSLKARLERLSEDLYFVAGSDEADASKLIDKSLDYLRIVRAHIRRLDAAAAKAKKVVGQP